MQNANISTFMTCFHAARKFFCVFIARIPSSPPRLNILNKCIYCKPDPAMFSAVALFTIPFAIRISKDGIFLDVVFKNK